MKFIILLILLSTIKQCFSFESVYVNFVPYQTSDCSGEISGVGYSGVIDTCMTLDDKTMFQFAVSGSNQINWSTYKATNFGSSAPTPCKPSALIASNNGISGSCVPSTSMDNINQGAVPMGSFYYRISVSTQVLIAPNSFVNTLMSTKNYGECDSGDIVIANYLTNGTYAQVPQYSIDRFLYLCIDNEPMVSDCKTFKNNPNKCAAPQSSSVICYETINFYNGSSFAEPTGGMSSTASSSTSQHSGSGTGGSGSASASSSGSGSSTSSGSGSSTSSTGSTSAQNDLNSNEFQSSSSSFTYTYYYQSTYCSATSQ